MNLKLPYRLAADNVAPLWRKTLEYMAKGEGPMVVDAAGLDEVEVSGPPFCSTSRVERTLPAGVSRFDIWPRAWRD